MDQRLYVDVAAQLLTFDELALIFEDITDDHLLWLNAFCG
jgi:hypothetical protein